MTDAEEYARMRARRRKRDRERYQERVSKPCRHCGAFRASRPKGLCYRCSYNPAILVLYATESKFAKAGTGLQAGPAPVPKAHTLARPGTAEKIAVMAKRVAGGFSCFHPDDSDMGGN